MNVESLGKIYLEAIRPWTGRGRHFINISTGTSSINQRKELNVSMASHEKIGRFLMRYTRVFVRGAAIMKQLVHVASTRPEIHVIG